MAESAPPPSPATPSPLAAALTATGLFYVGLGVVFGIVWVSGGVDASLFPTGWLFPVILIVSGSLMALRRRFDVVGTLWAGLALAVLLLDVLVHVNALDLRFDDPAAFDATIIVAAFGFVALLLRPAFRS